MSLFDRFATVWNDGQRGFGRESYNAAKALGISDRELSSGLCGARVGKIALENIQRGMGTPDTFSKFATIWNDNQLGFGQESYNAARRAGLTDQDILSSIQGQRIGRNALAQLNQGVQSAREAQTRQTERDDLRAQLESQLSSLQSRMASQQQQYQNSLAQMASERQEYQSNLARMSDSLSSALNPQTRENVLGVRGATNDTSNTAKLNRQGMKGSFARTGLRIKSLNI